MPEVAEVPVQNLDAVKMRVIASYRCMQSCVAKESKTSMERGWEAAAIERDSGWTLIGFTHQHDCRISLGVSYSNWYRTMAIAEKFCDLTKSEYMSMKLQNAELLSRQPQEIRYAQDNIAAAGDESIEEFSKKFPLPVPEPNKEHVSKFELKMVDSKKEAIEAGIRKFMADEEVDNASYALELMVAECTQGPTLTGFIQKSIPELTQAIREAGDLEDLRLLMLQFLQKMGELLLQCCGEES